MELSIRRATSGDAEAMLEYMRIVGGETDNLSFDGNGLPLSAEQEREFLNGLSADERNVMLVACDGPVLVGTAQLSCFSRRFAHRGELAVSVRKSWWDRGVGSRLLSALIDFAKDSAKVEVLSLEVRSDNERAISLYRKFGFETFGTYRKFFKIGGAYFDADYMNLYL